MTRNRPRLFANLIECFIIPEQFYRKNTGGSCSVLLKIDLYKAKVQRGALQEIIFNRTFQGSLADF